MRVFNPRQNRKKHKRLIKINKNFPIYTHLYTTTTLPILLETYKNKIGFYKGCYMLKNSSYPKTIRLNCIWSLLLFVWIYIKPYGVTGNKYKFDHLIAKF